MTSRLSWPRRSDVARGSDFDRRLREKSTELPGRDDVALLFAQPDGLFERRSRLPRTARKAQDLGEIGKRLCAQIKVVGPPGDLRRLARERLGLLDISAAG